MKNKFLNITAIAIVNSAILCSSAAAQCSNPPTLLENRAEVSRFIAQAGLGATEQDFVDWEGEDASLWIADQFSATAPAADHFLAAFETGPETNISVKENP